MNRLLIFALSLGLFSCVTQRGSIVTGNASGSRLSHSLAAASDAEDPFLWLEEVQAEKSIAWVKAHNAPTLKAIKEGPYFSKFEPELRKIILAKDRVPTPSIINGMIYNFWQDEIHVRGIWRRTSLAEYKKADPNWETILDIDQLAKDENENWVYKGSNCLAPQFDRCLLTLSRAGKDASVRREFLVSQKAFVKNGFVLPESKGGAEWIDQDTLYIYAEFGPQSLTEAGYPRTVRVWKRGQDLSDSKLVYEGDVKDVSVGATVAENEKGEKFHFFSRNPSFFEEEWVWIHDSAQMIAGAKPHLTKIDFPADVSVQGVYQDNLTFLLRSEWRVKDRTYAQGTLLAVKLSEVTKPATEWLTVAEIYRPTPTASLEFATVLRGAIVISELNHVKSRVYRYQEKNGKWTRVTLNLPRTGSVSLISGGIYEEQAIFGYADFLTPFSYFLMSPRQSADKRELLKQSPARFDAKGLKIEQHFVKSKDGTAIPYFLIAKKGLVHNQKNPTLLNGYGGFEIAETPFYSGTVGKVWLNQGGVYVLANIRGGGEYGPAWHQAALKERRQNAYDDFIAIAQDLIAKKITSPRHLGIMGGSNGGLLMGVMLTQRPELFNAIVCQVPLLDMVRFNKLLAGASWMGEYGNPDIPAEREYILKYSPYQNLTADKNYPEILFTGSTADDRVHPGHMRKMAAKMESFGKRFFYYENIEGGHGGAANLEQKILMSSIEWSYLTQKLK